MNLYYWKEKKNFGDLLGSLLLTRFTRLLHNWSTPENSNIVVVGSILEHLPEDWNGVIAGAGKLHDYVRNNLPFTRMLAIRGPLSLRLLGYRRNVVLADPGLLASELVPFEDKQYELGLVPHWSDTTLEHNPIFKRFKPKIIRVSDDPLQVIKEIGLCKKIVSSSLHGIVLADAFGIPRRIEIAPNMLLKPKQEGGLFKWKDYSASLNMALEIGVTQEVNRNIITEKQHEMFDVFEEIKSIFSNTNREKN